MHTHALLMFTHVASLTHETGPVLLLLLLRNAKMDIAILAFIIRVLLIANCLSIIVLATSWHLKVLLILVVNRLLLIFQQSLRRCVR